MCIEEFQGHTERNILVQNCCLKIAFHFLTIVNPVSRADCCSHCFVAFSHKRRLFWTKRRSETSWRTFFGQFSIFLWCRLPFTISYVSMKRDVDILACSVTIRACSLRDKEYDFLCRDVLTVRGIPILNLNPRGALSYHACAKELGDACVCLQFNISRKLFHVLMFL